MALVLQPGPVASEDVYRCHGNVNQAKMDTANKNCCKPPNQVMSYEKNPVLCEAIGGMELEKFRDCCTASGLKHEKIGD